MTEEAGQGHTIATISFQGHDIPRAKIIDTSYMKNFMNKVLVNTEYFNKTEAVWLIFMTHLTAVTCKLPVQCQVSHKLEAKKKSAIVNSSLEHFLQLKFLALGIHQRTLIVAVALCLPSSG